MYIVAVGDIMTGFTMFGPFGTEDEAIDWGRDLDGEEISVLFVQDPSVVTGAPTCDA